MGDVLEFRAVWKTVILDVTVHMIADVVFFLCFHIFSFVHTLCHACTHMSTAAYGVQLQRYLVGDVPLSASCRVHFVHLPKLRSEAATKRVISLSSSEILCHKKI